jgi:hypothetical protein
MYRTPIAPRERGVLLGGTMGPKTGGDLRKEQLPEDIIFNTMTGRVYTDMMINNRSRNIADITGNPAMAGWEVSSEEMKRLPLEL